MEFAYGLTSFLTVILIVTLVIGLIRPDALKKKGGAPIKRGPLLGGSLALLAIFGLVLNATEPASMRSSVNSDQAQYEQTVNSTKKLKTVPIDKVDIKEETKTESIPFTSTTQNDGSLSSGQTKVIQAGVNGTKTITYKVTYINGKETGRVEENEAITAQPVNQITAVGTYVAPAQPSCPNGSYINAYGNRVCSPAYSSSAPAGATAKCNDGTYSYSRIHSGTCSHHGGVAVWL